MTFYQCAISKLHFGSTRSVQGKKEISLISMCLVQVLSTLYLHWSPLIFQLRDHLWSSLNGKTGHFDFTFAYTIFPCDHTFYKIYIKLETSLNSSNNSSLSCLPSYKCHKVEIFILSNNHLRLHKILPLNIYPTKRFYFHLYVLIYVFLKGIF